MTEDAYTIVDELHMNGPVSGSGLTAAVASFVADLPDEELDYNLHLTVTRKGVSA